MRNLVINLVKEIKTVDEDGETVKEYEKREVFAEKKSITQNEFFSRRNKSPFNDLCYAHCFLIDTLEYDREQLLEYDGVLYKIYRLYEKYGVLEVYCEERGGYSGN